MRICCAGEVMVEMAAGAPAEGQRGVAGDSYNTAVYLARAGLSVDYLTRLGDDACSDDIINRLTCEGIGTDLITRCPGRQPGLYRIDNDNDGERHFSYWRDEAPARELFSQPADVTDTDVFYFTGITLAVTRADLDKLISLLQRLRQKKCRIVFDPNYRPQLWDSLRQAQQHYRTILPLCDMVLCTLEDDEALWGTGSVVAGKTFYGQYDIGELVIRSADLTAHAAAGEQKEAMRARAVVAVDTTGAGDAFNAGYLAVRLTGGSIAAALARAQEISAAVVQHHGAILPRN